MTHPTSWRIWNPGQRGLFVQDVFARDRPAERVDVRIANVSTPHVGLGRVLTTADGMRCLLPDGLADADIGLEGTRLLLGEPQWDPTSRWNSEEEIRPIVEIGHAAPRVGAASLAIIARLADNPHLILAAARDEAATKDKQGQVAIKTSDGTGDHDTDGINLRINDGRLIAAVGYLGAEVAWNRIRTQADLPASIAISAGGLPLRDIVAIDLLDGVEARVSRIGGQDGWIEIEFDDAAVPIPEAEADVMEMVEKARAGYARR